jgi:ABC-type phosphate/phosphonate transport system substrate-binding protein
MTAPQGKTPMRLSIKHLLICAAASCIASPVVATAQDSRPLHFALSSSFVTGKADTILKIASDDFREVLKATTGLDGDLTSKLNTFEIAEKLNAKQIDFGIFHAHEFAWLQKKHPDLEPLLVASNGKKGEQVFVVVNKKNPAKSFADLAGKKLDLPSGTSELCRVFVDKKSMDSGMKPAKDFFSGVEKSAAQVAALDNVAREKIDVTAVTTMWLEYYKDVKGPTFNNQLRILEQSEPFPPAVIVYKKGAVPEKTLEQFKSGLLKAHKTDVGREMMKDWNIESFEAVPADYVGRLMVIQKTYPAPESKR